MLRTAMNHVSLRISPLFLILLAGCDSTPKPEASKPAPAATESAPRAAREPGATGDQSGAPTAAVTAPAQPAAIPAPDDVAAPPKDGQKTASGLVTKVLTPGKPGKKPGPTDRVKVHYTGWTKDGKMFDSSVARGQPTMFGVGDVIKGWTEGLQLMVVGEKRRFWIPAALAYGETPRMGAPAGDLVFDVELIELIQPAKPPPVPTDVKAAPKDAKKTASGLAYKVLQKGKGTEHPTAANRVTVHYTGWTTDGKMFDSSVVRGEPTSFPLGGVIKGWTEGVQLMVPGEKTRFWIPGELAYGDKPTRPGAPSGMLVFDIELISIH